MRYLTAIILISVSVGVFYVFIDPLYADVRERREQISKLEEAISNSRQIQTIRDELLGSFNSISTADLSRLRTLLPDNIDNVRLIMEINRIAANHGVVLQDIIVSESASVGGGKSMLGPDERSYGTIQFSFTLSGSYDRFRNFLADLEFNLRLIDIVSLSFVGTDQDFNRYSMIIKTYWLR